nr:hypothetical protein [uncultured Treponema sp.]
MDRHTCKRNKALTCSFFAILAFIFSLVSCDNFNKPVREYFDYYTNTAGIGEMAVPESIGTWNGMPVIESDSDKEIIFYLRNPKNYTLLTECAYSDSNMPRGVIAQDTADKSRIKMLLEANDLVTYEESYPDDKIISGIITLQVDDGRPPFDGFFPFSILVNSAPPPIRGVTLQLSQNNSGTYILCFYAPKTNETVHIDTKKIYINSECYDFGTNGKPVNRAGITDSDPQFITITNPLTQLYPIKNTSITFSGNANAPANYEACYYDTKIPADYSGQMNYTVSLKDDYGFESTERITNSIRILKNPVINVTTGIYNADPDSKKYTVRISHDGKDTSGNSIGGNATVYYTVTETSGLTPFEGSSTLEGSASGTADIQLTKGTYNITTYVSKLDFIDSDSVTVSNIVIKEPAVFYVDGSNGKDDDLSYDGSINKPFKTINKALSAFSDVLTADNTIIKCTIYLKDDITVERADYQYHLLELNNFSGKTIELAGKTNKKIIDTTGYVPEGSPGDKALIRINENNSLILSNIEIKGYDVEYDPVIQNSGALTLDNSSITDCPWVTYAIINEGNIIFKGTVNVKNNKFVRVIFDEENNPSSIEYDRNITLQDGSTIDVSELSSGSHIGVKTNPVPGTGESKLIATGFPSGLYPWNIFTSDSVDYFIDYDSNDHTKVMLKKAGSSIEIGGADNLTVDVTSSTGVVNFKAHEGQFTALADKNLKCGFDTVPETEYDAVLKEDGTIEVTVSSLQPGSYVLNVTVDYNGSTHLLNLPFTK